MAERAGLRATPTCRPHRPSTSSPPPLTLRSRQRAHVSPPTRPPRVRTHPSTPPIHPPTAGSHPPSPLSAPRSLRPVAPPRSDEHRKATWRRGRDSNPRYGCPYTRFPSVLLRPLGHLSAHHEICFRGENLATSDTLRPTGTAGPPALHPETLSTAGDPGHFSRPARRAPAGAPPSPGSCAPLRERDHAQKGNLAERVGLRATPTCRPHRPSTSSPPPLTLRSRQRAHVSPPTRPPRVRTHPHTPPIHPPIVGSHPTLSARLPTATSFSPRPAAPSDRLLQLAERVGLRATPTCRPHRPSTSSPPPLTLRSRQRAHVSPPTRPPRVRTHPHTPPIHPPIVGSHPTLSARLPTATSFSPRPAAPSDRLIQLAERVGFEPTDPRGVNGFRDRPDRPLRHLSAPGRQVYPPPRHGATVRKRSRKAAWARAEVSSPNSTRPGVCRAPQQRTSQDASCRSARPRATARTNRPSRRCRR